MTRLVYPFTEKAVRALTAGEAVSVNGRIWTGRDRFHKHFADGGKLPVDFRDGALFHCGPVVVEIRGTGNGERWKVVAAGPTTSVRENPYEPAFIAATGVRLIIGKGGMDAATLAACQKHGAVYLQAVGGAAALAAAAVKRVTNVYFLEEFGAAEACWEFEVEDLPCVVAMDSHGTSLFDQVRAASQARLAELCPKA
jgi:fumarate hydratase class I